MHHGKCFRGLCPFSLGIAIGVTFAIAVFLWSVWIMYYGVPPMMEIRYTGVMTWGVTLVHTLFALIKGFIFGAIVALIYDGCVCLKPNKDCHCDHCGCKCCSEKEKPVDRRI